MVNDLPNERIIASNGQEENSVNTNKGIRPPIRKYYYKKHEK